MEEEQTIEALVQMAWFSMILSVAIIGMWMFHIVNFPLAVLIFLALIFVTNNI
jgi:hypothetical protein